MTTRYERHTGKVPAGAKWPEDPNAYRRRRAVQIGVALDVPGERETQLKRDLRELELVQRARPLKPPGKLRAKGDG